MGYQLSQVAAVLEQGIMSSEPFFFTDIQDLIDGLKFLG